MGQIGPWHAIFRSILNSSLYVTIFTIDMCTINTISLIFMLIVAITILPFFVLNNDIVVSVLRAQTHTIKSQLLLVDFIDCVDITQLLSLEWNINSVKQFQLKYSFRELPFNVNYIFKYLFINPPGLLFANNYTCLLTIARNDIAIDDI